MPDQIKKIQAATKHKQLKDILLEDIKSGKYPPNSKLPSTNELIRKYNVSLTTISRAKLDLVNEKAIYSIPGSGCFVTGQEGQEFHPQVKGKKILLKVNSMNNELTLEIISGIINVTQSYGYDLELYTTGRNYNSEMKMLTDCKNKQIAGMIFHPSFYSKNYGSLLKFHKDGTPVVLINRYLKMKGFDYVVADNLRGAKEAVNYLIKMGHKKILFLGDALYPESSEAMERLEGYKQALMKNKLRVDPGLIMADKGWGGPNMLRQDLAYSNMKKAVSQGLEFTAVFAHTDSMAIEAFKALKQGGMKVPDDVSLMGFGGSSMGVCFEVPLTTVRINHQETGALAAKILLKRINPNLFGDMEMKPGVPFTRRVVPELVIRNSVKKIN